MNPRRPASLRPGQFKHLIRIATVTGRIPERDVMLLWLTHTTGIRVIELALLEIGDVLNPAVPSSLRCTCEQTEGYRHGLGEGMDAIGDVEIVQTILGQACLDHSKPYLTVDMQTVRRAFELALA